MERENICDICKRTFPSVKALHGHMRWHPDKGYKGMIPPPELSAVTKGLTETDFLTADILMQLSKSGSVSTSEGSKIYVCPECGKSFSSYQGLGGHIASHNKAKGIPKEPSPSTEHRCQKCDQVFLSGQALGGHMRGHWSASNTDGANPSSSPYQQGKGKLMLFGYDLNELATNGDQ